jgi:hypothetical protein
VQDIDECLALNAIVPPLRSRRRAARGPGSLELELRMIGSGCGCCNRYRSARRSRAVLNAKF